MRNLFDISFKKFVSPTIVKIVYVLVMIGIALGYIGFTIAAFSADTLMGVLVLFLLGPLVSLIYLCLFRVMLEALVSAILTAQNTSELVRMQQGWGPATPMGSHPQQGR